MWLQVIITTCTLYIEYMYLLDPSSFSQRYFPLGSLSWVIRTTLNFSPVLTVKWSLDPFLSASTSTENNGLTVSGSL